MLSGEIRSQIDSIWNSFWTGGISNPLEVIEQKVAAWLPNENPKNVVSVLISWGRFSEVFGYNDDAKELYLDVGQETA